MNWNIKNIQQYKSPILFVLGAFVSVFLIALVWYLYKTLVLVTPLQLLGAHQVVSITKIDYSLESKKLLHSWNGQYMDVKSVLSGSVLPEVLINPSTTPFEEDAYLVFFENGFALGGRVGREQSEKWLQQSFPGLEVVYEKGVLFFVSGQKWSELSVKESLSIAMLLDMQHLSFSSGLIQTVFPDAKLLFAKIWSYFPDYQIEQYLFQALVPQFSSCAFSLQQDHATPHAVFTCRGNSPAMELLAQLPTVEVTTLPDGNLENHAWTLALPFSYDLFAQYARALETEKNMPVPVLLSSLLNGAVQKILPLPTIQDFFPEMGTFSFQLHGSSLEQLLYARIHAQNDEHDKSVQLLKKLLGLVASSQRVKESVVTLPDRTTGTVLSIDPVEAQILSASGGTLLSVEDFPVHVWSKDQEVFYVAKEDPTQYLKMEEKPKTVMYSTQHTVHVLLRMPLPKVFERFGTFWKDEQSSLFKQLRTTVSFTRDEMIFVVSPDVSSIK